MDNIKESFSNIVTWAKSHPWLAGGIVLLVIVIAWFVSKSIKSSGDGGTLDTGDQEATGLDLTGLGSSTGGGGSALGDIESSVLSSGGETVSPPALSSPSLPLNDLVDSGYFDTGSLPGAFYQTPTMSNNMQTAQGSGLSSFISSSPVAAMARPQQSPAMQALTSSISSSPVAAMARPQQSTSKLGNVSGSSGGKAQTPAQAVGKGRNFSGLYKGVVYVNGYPVGASNPGTQLNTGTISKSPVSKMKKPGQSGY